MRSSLVSQGSVLYSAAAGDVVKLRDIKEGSPDYEKFEELKKKLGITVSLDALPKELPQHESSIREKGFSSIQRDYNSPHYKRARSRCYSDFVHSGVKVTRGVELHHVAKTLSTTQRTITKFAQTVQQELSNGCAKRKKKKEDNSVNKQWANSEDNSVSNQQSSRKLSTGSTDSEKSETANSLNSLGENAAQMKAGIDVIEWKMVFGGAAQELFDFICENEENCNMLRLRGVEGETPLHMLSLLGHFDLARIVAFLYPKLVVDYYYGDRYHGENSVHIAIVKRNPDLVRFFLECVDKDDLNTILETWADGDFFAQGETCYFGQTVLGFAVSTNQIEIVKTLINDFGAQLDVQDDYGNNVLHLCVVHELPTMYDQLLELWQKYLIKTDQSEESVLANRLMNMGNKKSRTPLTMAAEAGFTNVFAHLLRSVCLEQWAYGPVTCFWIPLRDVDYIQGEEQQGAIELILKNGHMELVTLPLIKKIINRKWEKFGRDEFIRRMCVALFNALCFLIMAICQPASTVYAGVWDFFARLQACNNAGCTGDVVQEATSHMACVGLHYICRAIVTCVACYKLYLEVQEVGFEGGRSKPWYEKLYKGLKSYIIDTRGAEFLENSVSSSYCISFILSQLFEFIGSTNLSKPCLAVAGLLSWLYMLWFLLGFETTGPLAVMVWRMLVNDVLRFLCVTSVFLIGFSLAFFITSTTPGNRSLSTFGENMYTCFNMMYGDIDRELHKKADHYWTTLVLLLVFSVVVTILLLNMLIAMMGDTYSKVADRAEQEWFLERARIISSMQREIHEDKFQEKFEWSSLDDGTLFMQVEQVDESWGAEVRSDVVQAKNQENVSQALAQLSAQVADLTAQLQKVTAQACTSENFDSPQRSNSSADAQKRWKQVRRSVQMGSALSGHLNDVREEALRKEYEDADWSQARPLETHEES